MWHIEDYAIDDHSEELRNIDEYYGFAAYEDMMCACLL